MDPISIGAMLLSAFVQAKTQSDAAARQKRMAVESQQRALMSQNQATDAAMKRAQEFDPTVRKQNQDEVTQDITQQLEQSVPSKPITAQGVEVGATIPGGTADYLTSKARETAKAAESSRQLAALFGRIGGAQQLRRNEAVGFGDTAGEIGRIQSGANNMGSIDQIGIEAAGQPSLGGMLASSALGAYGMGRASLPGVAKMKPGAPGGFGGGSWLVGPQ